MSDLTQEKATALRKPFPRASIGKLPKPYKKDSPKGQCNECGGYHGLPAVHLDYVGHAATTDRLLTVDPEWTWEPMGVDQYGLPVPDAQGNLWIRLTVCGVTRIGVGDGGSAKERIGDAIRNAAMRFGVALDLWAKEDLVEFAQAARSHQSPPVHPEPSGADDAPGAATPVSEPASASEPATVTAQQLKKIGAAMRDLGITERSNALAYVNDCIGREVGSRNELTKHEAGKVIDSLERDLEQPFPEGGAS